MRLQLARPADVTSLDERRFAETPAKYRSHSQRDRDRILYSSALQRLGGITQVASPEVGHVFHSRLTHSLKVAQVARRLAERLQAPEVTASPAIREYIDPDAVEAASLAHDFGHPPFGHLAEEELDRKAWSIGGFEGNAQSFRILTRLSSRSSDSPGLNLSRRVLNGTIKYPRIADRPSLPKRLIHSHRPTKPVTKTGAYEEDAAYFRWVRRAMRGGNQSMEAALMDWADDVTYAVHDMDDFYRAGLIPLDRLCELEKELADLQGYLGIREPSKGDALVAASEGLFRRLLSINTRYRGVAEERINLRGIGSALITRYINAVSVEPTASGGWALHIPDTYRDEVAVLKALTWKYVIERPSLAVIQRGQRRVISELFDFYLEESERPPYSALPPAYGERLESASTRERMRTVVDLIASLTEAGALEIYRRMMGVRTGSIVDAAGERA
jgi:dGTPase